MNNEFDNALAWFSAAPQRWLSSAKQDMAAYAEWIWGVLLGDFNENQSTAQIATGTVISMIPFVDQICDVRDVIANCKKIDESPDAFGPKIALTLTLIGLFPTLGSLFKGCAKIAFASLRSAGYKAATKSNIGPYVEIAVLKLNDFLARPEVAKTLKALKIDNPYAYLATKFRDLSKSIGVGPLKNALNVGIDAAKKMLVLVQKWGDHKITTRAADVLRMLDRVRRYPDEWLAKATKSVQDYLDVLARRLEIEADMQHRAYLNTRNPHAFVRPTRDIEKAELLKTNVPWARTDGVEPYSGLSTAPVAPAGWTSTVPGSGGRGRHPMDNAHETFHTIKATKLPSGTVIYRVLDPMSSDNSICWMSKSEFDSLITKDDWRKRFAVWVHWNSNGEYVKYVVPDGQELHVWEGVTASQRLQGTDIVLEGGAIQLVVDPAHLKMEGMSKRMPTNWKYGDFGPEPSLVGVPKLENNWYKK